MVTAGLHLGIVDITDGIVSILLAPIHWKILEDGVPITMLILSDTGAVWKILEDN